MRLLSVAGYPYPGISADRWIFMLSGSDTCGLIWRVPPGVNIGSLPTLIQTFDASAMSESGISHDGVQIPTINDSRIDKIMLQTPIVLTLAGSNLPTTATKQETMHMLDTQGIECLRIDYMLPTAVAHIALDGTVTML